MKSNPFKNKLLQIIIGVNPLNPLLSAFYSFFTQHNLLFKTTGIHGFVGSNLVKALKNQHTIYGLDIVWPQKDGVNKTFSWDELKDIPPVDCIIHLAGKAHDTKNQTDAKVYFDINTGTIEHHGIQIVKGGRVHTISTALPSR